MNNYTKKLEERTKELVLEIERLVEKNNSLERKIRELTIKKNTTMYQRFKHLF